MRAAYITAGAAGMYCGSCLQDNALAAALLRDGHDVALVPTYTPMRTDEVDVSIDRVFYGALNVYLEQKVPLFRVTPWLVDRMLNGRRLLGWISNLGSTTHARDLGAMTLSVLQGEEGKQRKELEKLLDWLKKFRPEIVHLTNSMFVGFARQIKRQLKVPVLCSVQGEDLFLQELVEPFRSRAHDTLRERAGDVDGFMATSRYYADFMADYLAIPKDRMHRVKLGLNLEGHGDSERESPCPPLVIGYLARICPEKGLHLLVEAFRSLVGQTGREKVRLKIAGYLGSRDRAYLQGILSQLRSWGLEDLVEYVGEVDRRQKIEFLGSIHVLSVPTVYREPKGRFVLEALANGVPVVQPSHGAFPEMIQATGGGVLVDPGSPEALAAALRALLEDPVRRRKLGRAGKAVVHRDYSDAAMAEQVVRLYRAYIG